MTVRYIGSKSMLVDRGSAFRGQAKKRHAVCRLIEQRASFHAHLLAELVATENPAIQSAS